MTAFGINSRSFGMLEMGDSESEIYRGGRGRTSINRIGLKTRHKLHYRAHAYRWPSVSDEFSSTNGYNKI